MHRKWVSGACLGGLVLGVAAGCGKDTHPPVGSPASDGGFAVVGAADANVCASAQVGATRVTPQVTVIVDQSGSMRRSFPGSSSRWDAVRDALVGPSGIITELEGVVDFGLSLYTAIETDALPNLPKPGTECPLVQSVPMASRNKRAIEAVYAGESPRDETPTGDAVTKILEDYLAVPDPSPDPTYFILATDGVPDRCEQLNHKGLSPAESEVAAQIAQQEAIDAIERAHELGITTYVMSVGTGSVALDHLQDLANAGVGYGSSAAPAPYWEAGDEQGLRDAFSRIVGNTLSCDIRLEGRIDIHLACQGYVTLNGRILPCDGADGWRVIDEQTIALTGTSCDELQSSVAATVEAQFPCEVLVY